MDYFYIVCGLVLLFLGGEALVRGSMTLSKRLGISALLIAIVVVGFGTSAPELLVSIKASLQGQPDLALGNVVGSNIANMLLILGIAGLINPIDCHAPSIKRDALVVVLASTVLTILSYVGIITRLVGLGMILTLITYLIYSYQQEKKQAQNPIVEPRLHKEDMKQLTGKKISLLIASSLSVGGILMLVLGADFLIKGATNVAHKMGISEATIGLSIVAIGTSLPEIATAISASLKKHSDVIIGNVLGSNLFNILSILGVTALILPIPISQQLQTFDIPFSLIIAIVTLILIHMRKRISRMTALLFLSMYVAYMTWLYMSGLTAP